MSNEQFECLYPIAVLASSVAVAYVATKCKSATFQLPNYSNPLKRLKINEVNTIFDSRIACSILKNHCKRLNVLGFDCEWVNTGRQNPVALLQLATSEGLCVLFRLNHLKTVPADLKEILEDENVIKVGVCPGDDAKLLLKDYNVHVRSSLDLRHLYPECGGLASLTKHVLGLELDKNWKIRCSDWEAVELSDKQKEYAAKDALVAVEIFKQWSSKQSGPFWKFWHKEEDATAKIHSYLDVGFKIKHNFQKAKTKPVPNLLLSGTNVLKGGDTAQVQNQKVNTRGIATRKSPLYHNCFMHAPDGELLCSCDQRKAEWYVDKGLAEVVPGEPFSIKLLFEPAGRAGNTNEGRFYTQLKKNCCVVCGAKDSYLRHNVVPREYRKHFPPIMKDHQSHDVVLTCVDCHTLAGMHDEALRQTLAIMCDAPINNRKTIDLKSTKKVQKSAKALLVSGASIPPDRKKSLEDEIKEFHQVNEVTKETLMNTMNLENTVHNEDHEPHGLKVVKHFINNANGLLELEKMWRENFLTKMAPKYLPALWSVNHNHERLAVRAADNRVETTDLQLAGLPEDLLKNTFKQHERVKLQKVN